MGEAMDIGDIPRAHHDRNESNEIKIKNILRPLNFKFYASC